MTPEQLRASILQQAMEGKLVEQDPNDEPASVLLERIAEEKARLIKEKKIKRTKKLPEITDDEKPFAIPSSWEWVRLGQLFDITSSKRVHKNEWTHAGIPFYRAREIVSLSKNEVFKDPIFISEQTYEDKIKDSGIPALNDILVTGVGTLGVTYVVKDNHRFYFKDGNIIWLKNYFGMNTDFIEKVFMSPLLKNTLRKKRGTTVGTFTIVKANNTVIPFPPLAEQKRIVARLDQLMPLVDEYAEAYDKLKKLDDGFNDKLKQSLLQYAMEGKLVKQDPDDEPASELLKKIKDEKKQLVKEKKIKRSKSLPRISEDEKLFDIPENWEWVRLTEVGSWGAGATPSRSHPEYYNGGIPWLKTGDLNDGVISSTSETISQAGADNSSVRFNQPGNILIAMYGATIGKLGIAGISLTTNQACCGCKTFDGIYNWYLFYYLLAMRPLLIDQGSGGAQPNISKTKIEKFPFALPPLAEQKRIVAKINQLMATIH